MKSRILVLTLVAGLALTAVLTLSSAAVDQKNDDVQDAFEASRTSLLWNNQLAGLLRSNKIETVKTMVVMRVAYEVASIRNIQSKLNPNDLAKAKEMYLDAYPTLKPLENSTNVTRMPKKYKEGLELYFEDMKKLGNAH